MKNRIPDRCQDFRELLERALCEPAAKLEPLAWHEHLGVCAECRTLLEEEEALEQLLASLPLPALPEALTDRVLARLRDEHDRTDLDALLELDQPEEPKGLTARVLGELELDRLLARVPEPEVPAGLSARVLAGLEPERSAPAGRVIPLRRLAPVAAALVALLAFFALRGEDKVEPPVAVVPVEERPSEELLAVLDLLGDESLWMDDVSEIDIALSLDESDELLLEYLAMTDEEER